jgi:hypothetical protein
MEGMTKRLISCALAVGAAVGLAVAAKAQINVLQNISLQLTIYQQGATNPNGRKVSDQVIAYTTKSLITNLEAVTGQPFGSGAKLVLSTLYSNTSAGSAIYSTLFSTNLALASNTSLIIGGLPYYGDYDDTATNNYGVMMLSNNTILSGDSPGSIRNSIVSVVTTSDVTNASVALDTNALATLTPSTDANGDVTNVAVLEQQVTAGSGVPIVSNGPTTIAILYDGANLYPVTNYIGVSQISPAQIVVETGKGLDTTNALTVTNLASQTGFSIQGLNINYSTPSGSNYLNLDLQGFVKQTLKVDTLAAKKGTNTAVVADVFGANATWNVNGWGDMGENVTNASPIVVDGTVTVSFLKNLAQ